QLRWQAAPRAAHYLVTVMEVDRTELWKSESTETSVSLPAAIRKAIVPGKTVLWQVTAVGADQRTLGSSKTMSFRLPVRAGSSKDLQAAIFKGSPSSRRALSALMRARYYAQQDENARRRQKKNAPRE